MLSFRCASCKKKIETDDSLAGQQGECPFCGKVVVAPGTAAAPASQEGGGFRDYPRCPKCGARRKESDRRCGFCGETIPETASVRAKTTRKVVAASKEDGPDRRKLILGGLGAGLVAVIAGVWFFNRDDDTPDYPPDDQCRRQMLGLMNGLVEYGSSEGGLPKSTGSEFWLTIARKKNMTALLKCPAAKGSGASDYQGPAKIYDEVGGGEALLACKHHPGGLNVITKSGSVDWVAEGSERHARILKIIKD